ncbi:MAG: pyridoxamine 5'-phosphate oxidase family protein [Candidatus Vogelbacteria bacterium]|nr:pyridoxamine 5'-phosphate oxidase family protein [Candidatus Vogelbacteria bacterium]
MKTKKFNWKKYIIACLNSTQFFALATVNKDKVWVCPVYFAFDKKLQLFFISQPSSRHMRNIMRNPSVAVAIYSTAQEPRKDVFGVKFEGMARVVSGASAIKYAHLIYFKITPYRRPVKAGDYMSPKGSWLFVKIIPKQMYYFDTKFFGENRQKVPTGVFGR